MNRKKQGFITAVGIILLFMAVSMENDPVKTLIERTIDSKLKKKIVAFKKGGYERTINCKNYDPETIIKSAKTFLGVPHKMGGTSAKGIDCSGLVMIAHKHNQVTLPHSSNEQARYGTIILSIEKLKRGNLVFFHSTYNTSNLVTHSGIYLGEGTFIHVSTKNGVIVSDINSDYWKIHFLFGTKLM